MCSKSETTNTVELDHTNSNSQPWWKSNGYNAAPSLELGDPASKTSLELPPDGCMVRKDGKTQADSGLDGSDTVRKEAISSALPQSGLERNYGQHLQQLASIAPPAGVEYLVPQTQPELVGHSIACAPYPYPDPYYGGLLTAYGAPTLVNPQFLGMHHTRMPLPLEMAEDPVYVNPKQYNGIMRRRQSRAKAELEKKLIKVRKPYLHESRHQHAMRRQRGCGGRFVNTKKRNDGTHQTPENGSGSASDAPNRNPATPPGSTMTNQFTVKLNASDGQEEFKKGHKNKYSNDDSDHNCYEHHQDFRLSAFHPLSGERGEEGDCSGQLRGSISVRQASCRALAI
ncbi:Nuclear transcription factor y subunit a [Thalictrum thalictroides]|uniref:Nuclear transcription factor Y subunit n=1 Tax=Thalictrum thalictroides TaxID=46969 RepID=A0A7J6X5E8_THATH|nr:Nuclear transcription factor y subunit a [Thalictrum thalictroides]